MCTHCTLYSLSALILQNVHIQEFTFVIHIWQTYTTGIIKIELTNVEIQEQIASLDF